MTDALLEEGVRVLALGSGTSGHEVNVLGVVEALGAPYEMRAVEPRAPFGWTAPFGPIDPKDRSSAPGSILAPPFPDVVIACGRVTVPYIRAIKREGGERVFAAFLQDPRHARSEMDLIWAPEHDALRGPNVMTTLTSPHPFSPARIAAARRAPDPRIASLPRPRCGIVLGGPSRSQHFTSADISRLREATRAILAQGSSVMATPSRRTPPALIHAVREGLGSAPGFVWDGDGDNPYLAILALADALLVTSDSANMVGEATATGAPVHIFDPSGGETLKRAASIDALIRAGAVRRFGGALERFSYAPINSSAEIAREIARRFRASRASLRT
jgi:uncharacterized protein